MFQTQANRLLWAITLTIIEDFFHPRNGFQNDSVPRDILKKQEDRVGNNPDPVFSYAEPYQSVWLRITTQRPVTAPQRIPCHKHFLKHPIHRRVTVRNSPAGDSYQPAAESRLGVPWQYELGLLRRSSR